MSVKGTSKPSSQQMRAIATSIEVPVLLVENLALNWVAQRRKPWEGTVRIGSEGGTAKSLGGGLGRKISGSRRRHRGRLGRLNRFTLHLDLEEVGNVLFEILTTKLVDCDRRVDLD